jgi:probable HAF family extracellular repeat protein
VAYQSSAFGINANGTLVGWSQQVFNGASQAWVQNGSRISYLPGLVANAFVIEAQGINNTGDVVGWSSTTAGVVGLPLHAVLWKQSKAIDLGTLPGAGAGAQSAATAINNTGTILGESDGPQGPSIVVVWKNGVIHALSSGSLPGTSGSIAYGINDEGDVVGLSEGYTKPYVELATLWRDGRIYDLNRLIDPSVSKYVTLTAAYGINNAGWIAAVGVDSRYSNQSHAYLLWLPCSEP